ncbi:archaeoflavoprotein AfpA [Methanomethylovorans hollandica DSM 15978]|uniref:Archaeoflavoprotein AfpA n=1 Tax=Methanomethylovorans hollandica (strain DSM 15978 / NBRC 107637 / DMS1) TaxID=867904 RepID=L0KZ86_METHD|nr:archaeoflavoprotein AfpA [Methanomethylovorans hollandica]AGB50416.1 archaeoflavoprotein AfpA [Methanomethylovorans hollandica DSM 15978]
MKRIAWGITGSGDLIRETCDIMLDIKKRADIELMTFLSKEGEVVLKWYKMWDDFKTNFPDLKTEGGPNSPFIAGPLQLGHYDMLIIAPATANTVAKIVHGIADTLVTNAVSQTAKGDTPIYILPVDRKKGTVTTYSPKGKEIILKMRDIDIENTEKLSRMENIIILDSPEELYRIIGVSKE